MQKKEGRHLTVVGGGKLFGVSSDDKISYNDNYNGNKVWGNYVLMICKSFQYFKNFFYRLNWLNSVKFKKNEWINFLKKIIN